MEAEKKSIGESNLNDSWVELHFASNPGSGLVSRGESDIVDASRPSTSPSDLERLLLEAQAESGALSRSNSIRSSPKSPHSPASPEKETDITQLGAVARENSPNSWVWDWSSRIEAIPPREFAAKLKHPLQPRNTSLSMRKSKLLSNALWSWDNLPALLLSHACTFFLGAAAMFMYLKKYCKWAAAGANLTMD